MRREAEQTTTGSGKREKRTSINNFFKHQNFKRYGTQHQFQRENRTSFIL